MSGAAKRRSVFSIAATLALSAAVVAGAWLLPPWRVTAAAPPAPSDLSSDAPVQASAVDATEPALADMEGHPLAQLAERSPEEAWRAAAALDDSALRPHLLEFIGSLWIERDPVGAMDALESMGEELAPLSWMIELLGRWMATDPEAATDWALTAAGGRSITLIGGAMDFLLHNAEPRRAVLLALVRIAGRWGQRAPNEAWEFLATMGDGGDGRLLAVAAGAWAESEPRAALNAAVAHDEWQTRRESWIAELAGEWAREAPRAAADWLRKLPEPSRQPALVAAIHAPLSVVAPDEAFALGRDLNERGSGYAHEMYGQQLRRLLGDDPRVLADWLAAQPEDGLRFHQISSIAKLYGEKHADEAVEWALDLPERESWLAIGDVVKAIAEEDPSSAQRVVLRMTDRDVQIEAAKSLLGHWAAHRGEHTAAYEWAAENLPIAVRRAANRNLFANWGFTSPSTVASAVETIADSHERRNAQLAALYGMLSAGGGLGGFLAQAHSPEQASERMAAMDRLCRSMQSDGLSLAESDLGREASLLLYQYWNAIDPNRASRYKELAERLKEAAAQR